MKPVDECAGRAALSAPAEPLDPFRELDAPDFAGWASAEDMPLPDLPDFAPCGADSLVGSHSISEGELAASPGAWWETAPDQPPPIISNGDNLVPEPGLSTEESHSDLGSPEESIALAAVQPDCLVNEPKPTRTTVETDPPATTETSHPLDSRGAGSGGLDGLDSNVALSCEVPAHSDSGPDEEPDRGARRAWLMELAARLWTDSPAAPTETAGDRCLICTLGDEEFALPLDRVVEVQRMLAVTPVPHVPAWVLGVTNRRGEIISVVDLAAFLGRGTATASPNRRLVVVQARGEEISVGLVVDHVAGMHDLEAVAVAPTFLDLEGLLLSDRMRRLDLD